MASIIDSAAIIISVSALFAYVNYRFIGLPTTIGVMVVAMLMLLLVYLLGLLGFAGCHSGTGRQCWSAGSADKPAGG